MVSVTEHYDAYPYPARDPADEAKRLITGSPSRPAEIDHFIFGGCRDWRVPLRVLVAGGGSGDGLIQLAQLMTSVGRPYEITYLDLSTSARKVAEARAKARGLTGITFHTGSLLDAPDYGQFDYIDCCGVLHHLPDPAAGFAALSRAVTPAGGLGFMVYAPYGRSGVYPLQQAFAALLAGLSPQDRLKEARAILTALPEGHPFKVNTQVTDHRVSDAGFYDLLLHGQDTAFDVTRLITVIESTGWSLVSFCKPALYDPTLFAPKAEGLSEVAAMAVAEKLRGTIKTHVGYAVPAAQPRTPASGAKLTLVPHLSGGRPADLARHIAAGKPLRLKEPDGPVTLDLPAKAAPLIAAINGRRNLSEIAAQAQFDPLSFGAAWGPVDRALTGWGLLHYSGIAR